jgi:hypothetical protein
LLVTNVAGHKIRPKEKMTRKHDLSEHEKTEAEQEAVDQDVLFAITG